MYPHHFRADKVWVTKSSVDFPNFGTILKQAKFVTSGHFLENAREEWPELWHADVSWPPSELIKVWSRSVDFPFFGIILTKWNRWNLGYLAIFFRMHWRNGLQFDMLLYPYYLFNCLHFGHGLLIFLILAGIWLRETSHIWSFQAFSWERIGGIGWSNLVIFEEMEKANFSILKLSSHPAGGITDCCVVRLF